MVDDVCGSAISISSRFHHAIRNVEMNITYLGPDEEIPSLDEMSADISCGLTDDLHSNVVPTISSIHSFKLLTE
jgi:hypothetical protein